MKGRSLWILFIRSGGLQQLFITNFFYDLESSHGEMVCQYETQTYLTDPRLNQSGIIEGVKEMSGTLYT